MVGRGLFDGANIRSEWDQIAAEVSSIQACERGLVSVLNQSILYLKGDGVYFRIFAY